MDWADGVAYCVHDLEDAIVSGPSAPAHCRFGAEADVVTLTAGSLHNASDIDTAALEEAADRVRPPGVPWLHDYDQSARSGALKSMTSVN